MGISSGKILYNQCAIDSSTNDGLTTRDKIFLFSQVVDNSAFFEEIIKENVHIRKKKESQEDILRALLRPLHYAVLNNMHL